MKITFDSNAWEQIFSSEVEPPFASNVLREAMMSGRMQGFISEAAFRIEAISKIERAKYFAEPHATTSGWTVPKTSNPNLIPLFSFGPDDECHPGIPMQQIVKLKLAATHGVQIIRTQNWLGLPSPFQQRDIIEYVSETGELRSSREERQILAFHHISKRGVGKAAFDEKGGWKRTPTTAKEAKTFASACAEWADGELVAAHIGYQNDVICTNDFGRTARNSVFNKENRAWLAETYNVRFATIDELVAATRS